ncbi:MAG: HAD family hydrolase [Candidatus Eiseniibacteriota bacterium]
MSPRHRLVWLFDVDGTLLLTDGAAREAFAFAVRERLGVEDDLRDIAFAGRTDPVILGDILAKHGRALPDGEAPRFWATARGRMEALLTPGRGRLLPGISELLAAVGEEPSWVSALLTGNTTGMARIKLEHFGIAERFAFGAFGEEADDRNALAKVAVARARERYGVPPGRCIVVGDTEHDIACARAASARVMAVATGVRDREALAAHRPDLLVDDFSDVEPCLAFARDLAAGD